MKEDKVIVTESTRDAMQGLSYFIPTEKKIRYIQKITDSGFNIIDIGSFVSDKAVPQMRDTSEVLKNIDKPEGVKFSVIVGNHHYAEKALGCPSVDIYNYPFSVSDIFLKKNVNADLEKASYIIDKLIELGEKHNKEIHITLATAFGNPYGEEWSKEILAERINILVEKGLKYIPLADTTASADSDRIFEALNHVYKSFPEIDFNLHLHTVQEEANSKIEAAYEAGCRSFDGVFGGLGGCPMSGKKMVGNLNTLSLILWLNENIIKHSVNITKLFDLSECYTDLFQKRR